MSKPDFTRQPWKHPACWNGHLVAMTRDWIDGVPWSVASCECGWRFSSPTRPLGPEQRDVAIHEHWLEVIATAEASPA